MANDCAYTLKAVSKDEKSLRRLADIMQYKDNEYFIYRVFSADCYADVYKEGDFFAMNICGDVAWSMSSWFVTEENFNIHPVKDYERDANGKKDLFKRIYGTAHYITLDLLCKKLDIGIEAYSAECGYGFQQHCLINHKGEEIYNETVDWSEEWEDEDGNVLDEPIITGGFDDYEEFITAAEIYGE